jgi:hypothetical protein
MTLDPSRTLGLDPDDPTRVRTAADAMEWAWCIPGFGDEPEAFALFVDEDQILQRAVWLGPDVDFDDLADWPDHLVGYAPTWGAAGVLLLVCRPGEGTEPLPGDAEIWDAVRLAHAARDLPLLDVVLVDGPDWCSLAQALA